MKIFGLRENIVCVSERIDLILADKCQDRMAVYEALNDLVKCQKSKVLSELCVQVMMLHLAGLRFDSEMGCFCVEITL